MLPYEKYFIFGLFSGKPVEYGHLFNYSSWLRSFVSLRTSILLKPNT